MLRGLLRLRLLRRQRERLLTTSRGRELLDEPAALLAVLCDDMGAADRFDAAAWPLVEAELRQHESLDVATLVGLIRVPIHLQGWRDEDGERFDEHALWRELVPLLCQAEAYGLVERDLAARKLTLRITAAERQLSMRR